MTARAVIPLSECGLLTRHALGGRRRHISEREVDFALRWLLPEFVIAHRGQLGCPSR